MDICKDIYIIVLSYALVFPCCNCQSMDQIMQAALNQGSGGRSAHPGNDDYEKRRIEFDIALTEEQFQQEKSASSNRKKRMAIKGDEHRWKYARIPYTINNVFSTAEVREIQSAIAVWEKHTCVSFTLRDEETEYVAFTTGFGCSSLVGRHQGQGRHEVRLGEGCRQSNTIIHELGHVIGFWHTQSRPDRDRYINIKRENILLGYLPQFRKRKVADVEYYGIPYDYKSIMHYGQYYFSYRDGVNRTIETNDSSMQNVIGTVQGPSFYDIKLANIMYSCGATCPRTPACPDDGFRGWNCKCICPGNPTELCNMCSWLSWGEWSPCSKSCGNGTRTRYRYQTPRNECNPPREISRQNCIIKPCQECKNQQLTGVTGTFSSPNYPNSYPNNKECTWTVTTAANGVIILTFNTFQLEVGDLCEWDYVKVHDGKTEQGLSLGKYCGDDVPKPIRSRGRNMHIVFRSDATVTEKGFQASYQISGCTWGSWGTWESCKPCDTIGRQIRRRFPTFGSICPNTQETRSKGCFKTCSVCTWGSWGNWGSCDKPCGGRQIGRRYPTFGSNCPKTQESRTRICSRACPDPPLMKCDFETPCAGLYISRNSDNYDWQRTQCCKNNPNPGSTGDHTLRSRNGYFMQAVAISGTARDLARMRNQPRFKHSHSHICLRFWYHMKGVTRGDLYVFYLEEGQPFRRVWSAHGYQGDAWKQKTILIATTPNSYFQVEFEAVRRSDSTSYISVDDILITSGTC